MSDLSILDALTQHNAYLQRLSSTAINEMLRVFDRLSSEQIGRLRDLLDELSDSERVALSAAKYTTPALKEIREVMRDWQGSIATNLPEVFAVSATALAVYESGYAYKMAGTKIPKINGEAIFNKSKRRPFAGGQLIDLVFPNIAEDLRKKVEYTLRDGISSGQTNQQIIQRIKGTKRLNYADGLLNQTRTSIDAGVRTARAHISNDVYTQTWIELGFEYTKDVATLDGRTSSICASRDGRVQKIDSAHQNPPYHYRCRTIQVGCDKDGNIAGERPYVASDKPVSKIPKDKREGLIGQVSANTDFKSWFSRQDAVFQEGWLGPNRYKLFKEGKYSIDKFVDPLSGKQFTLKELKSLDEKVFEELGVRSW